MQKERPSLYTLVEEMKRITVPTLVITGDEDWPCLMPGILMKQNIPSAALAVMPNSGHAINIEEPEEYNRIVGDFLAQVDNGRWPHARPARDERVDHGDEGLAAPIRSPDRSRPRTRRTRAQIPRGIPGTRRAPL